MKLQVFVAVLVGAAGCASDGTTGSALSGDGAVGDVQESQDTDGSAASADGSDDGTDSAAADGSDSGRDGELPADGLDAVDGADSAVLTDPPLPDWPDAQPGLTDPTARQWFRAGAWYKEDPDALDKQLHDLFAAASDGQPLGDPQGVVSCHAGTKASGKTAAKVYSKIVVPDTIIILAPNHMPIGKHAAIWNAGPWIVPGLAVPTRTDIVERFLELLPEDLEGDRDAFEHQNAHPSEMPGVYLSRKNPNIKIVQISFFDDEKVDYQDFDAERVLRVGHAVSKVVKELQDAGEKVLLFGSVDLSHYEPLADFDAKDADMMERLQFFDIDGLRTAVIDGNYTICAEIALSIWMVAMHDLGFTGLDVTMRGNSVELSGEKSAVGYPGGIVWR